MFSMPSSEAGLDGIFRSLPSELYYFRKQMMVFKEFSLFSPGKLIGFLPFFFLLQNPVNNLVSKLIAVADGVY